MNKELTEVVFVIDRSGSMARSADEAISGFNKLLSKQKKEPGQAHVTLVVFNHEYHRWHNGSDINVVPPLDDKTYVPSGFTALYDAVGRTIHEVGSRLAQTPEDERPVRVIVCVITDGMENSSTEYSRKQVREMINHQEEKYGWKFIYLGAHLEARDEARRMGISHYNTVQVPRGPGGQSMAYAAASSYLSETRSGKDVTLEDVAEKWSATDEDDSSSSA